MGNFKSTLSKPKQKQHTPMPIIIPLAKKTNPQLPVTRTMSNNTDSIANGKITPLSVILSPNITHSNIHTQSNTIHTNITQSTNTLPTPNTHTTTYTHTHTHTHTKTLTSSTDKSIKYPNNITPKNSEMNKSLNILTNANEAEILSQFNENISKQHFLSAMMLIDEYKNINFFDYVFKNGDNILHKAIRLHKPKFVLFLLQKGINVCAFMYIYVYWLLPNLFQLFLDYI